MKDQKFYTCYLYFFAPALKLQNMMTKYGKVQKSGSYSSGTGFGRIWVFAICICLTD